MPYFVIKSLSFVAVAFICLSHGNCADMSKYICTLFKPRQRSLAESTNFSIIAYFLPYLHCSMFYFTFLIYLKKTFNLKE